MEMTDIQVNNFPFAPGGKGIYTLLNPSLISWKKPISDFSPQAKHA